MKMYRHIKNRSLYTIQKVINGSFTCCGCGAGYGCKTKGRIATPYRAWTHYGWPGKTIFHANLDDFDLVGVR